MSEGFGVGEKAQGTEIFALRALTSCLQLRACGSSQSAHRKPSCSRELSHTKRRRCLNWFFHYFIKERAVTTVADIALMNAKRSPIHHAREPLVQGISLLLLRLPSCCGLVPLFMEYIQHVTFQCATDAKSNTKHSNLAMKVVPSDSQCKKQPPITSFMQVFQMA